jgi:hypothetical protein
MFNKPASGLEHKYLCGKAWCYSSERCRARIIEEDKHYPKNTLTPIRLIAMYKNISVLIRLFAISKDTHVLI